MPAWDEQRERRWRPLLGDERSTPQRSGRCSARYRTGRAGSEDEPAFRAADLPFKLQSELWTGTIGAEDRSRVRTDGTVVLRDPAGYGE
jgi:hypothetical protein